ncbi:MAG: hypothetical protein P0116_04730 [Candidatus Nitrosocosmicus sp.]|nr:hypothetical protein [Candidatus Nitrosocosmicus sp.]
MTVSLNSLNSSHNLSKGKAFGIQTTRERFKMHHIVIPGLMMTFLVAACMMFVLSALEPDNVSKVFAQGQHYDLNQDSDEKSGTQSSSDSTPSSSSKDKVTIDLNSVDFAPLTSSENNQLKLVINYQTKDPSLVNTPMAGTMKVYDSDGNIIKTSNIGNGYVLGQSGPMQFATTFTDNTIADVKAEVYLTDTMGNKISNTLTTDASLSM